jgi:arylsulfatase A-like enzyme
MSQPNIILVLTEQQRGDCLGIDGHPVLLTPNMDAIAGAGVRFSRAYANCPSCIAARRTILSGQFPVTHGLVGYQGGVPWEIEDTLPAVLARNGYQTAWVGRSMHQHPLKKRFGFETVINHEAGEDNEYMQFFRERRPDDWEGPFGAGVLHNDWTARPWHLHEDLHPTNWTVHEALRFLRDRDSSRPFFLVVSFLAAHPPLVPPAFYMERYLRTGVPDPVVGDWAEPPRDGGLGMGVDSDAVDLRGEALLSARAGYYGLINHVDDQLRRILNPYTGVYRMTDGNTAVIATSDHGEMLGDHYCWGKRVPYEPSVRVPMLMRAPERFGIQPGTVADVPVSLADVMPTILDLAGVAVPKGVDGRSLLPAARREASAHRGPVHIEHAPVHHTLTDGSEKYVWFVEDGREQFFSLSDDPAECHDLAGDPAWTARLTHWRSLLIARLSGRKEGFSDGTRLNAGRAYPPVYGTDTAEGGLS